MVIASHILIVFLFLILCGFIAVYFIFFPRVKNNPKNLWAIIPSIGYVFSQLLYWIIYIPSSDSVLSIVILFSISTILLITCIVITSRNKSWHLIKNILPLKKDLYILLVISAIILISSWQYFLIGPGNYYHSGNEDFFDGITGGKTYLSNTPISNMLHDYKIGWPIQYSSQALFRLLLNVNGIDAFLIQSIINLILTSLGVYWLVFSVFKGSRKIALLSAFWSVVANFYMTTYLNGHIGSMMYGSVVPVFIGLLILWIRREIGSYWLLVLIMILIFLHFTYPGPIYFLVIPAGLYIIHQRILLPNNLYEYLKKYFGFDQTITFKEIIAHLNWNRVLPVFIGVVILLLPVAWFVYDTFEPRRIQALLRTNVSWKISLYKEMFMIFWGIYPSGSTGTLSALPLFISSEFINNISLILSLIITALTFFAGLKFLKDKNKIYLFLYTVLFIPFFIMMRYFWGSPYYFYKFLYVNYFLVIIILFLWLGDFYKSDAAKILKRTLFVFLLFVGILNVTWNFAIGFDYYHRPYNDKENIDDFFKNTNSAELSEAALEIPNWINNMVFEYIFYEKGIKLSSSKQNAKYLIQLKNYSNVFHNSLSDKQIIYENKLLLLFKKPVENSESIYTLYEPELYGNININWIGNEVSVKKEILKHSIESAKLFFTKNLNGKVYLDVFDSDVFTLLNLEFNNAKIPVGNYIFDSQYLITVKGGKSILSDYGKGTTLWEDGLLRIVKLKIKWKGMINQKLNVNEVLNNEKLLDGIDLNEMINSIKRKSNSVCIEIENNGNFHIRHSWLFFVIRYLKELLFINNIKIENSLENSEVVLRISLSDIVKVNNSKLNLIWFSSKSLGNWGFLNFSLIDKIKLTEKYSLQALSTDDFMEKFFFNSTNDFYLMLNNLSENSDYLRLLLAPGPSIDFKHFYLRIAANNRNYDKILMIEYPKTILDINISEFKNDKDSVIELSFVGINLLGHSLLPLDDRYLNYQIMAVELTDRIDTYSDYMIKALSNPTPSRFERLYKLLNISEKTNDIIQKRDEKKILFGLGWYPYEEFGEEKFRWVGNKPAEVIVDKNSFNHENIIFDLEPGPGNSNKPLPIDFFIDDQLMQTDTLNERVKVSLNISDFLKNYENDYLTIKMVPHSKNIKIGKDPRILNFRVFDISTH